MIKRLLKRNREKIAGNSHRERKDMRTFYKRDIDGIHRLVYNYCPECGNPLENFIKAEDIEKHNISNVQTKDEEWNPDQCIADMNKFCDAWKQRLEKAGKQEERYYIISNDFNVPEICEANKGDIVAFIDEQDALKCKEKIPSIDISGWVDEQIIIKGRIVTPKPVVKEWEIE